MPVEDVGEAPFNYWTILVISELVRDEKVQRTRAARS